MTTVPGSFFKTCLITGAPDIHVLKGYERHFLVKSKSSGFVFCSKIPTQEELETHYLQYDREDYLSPVTIKRYNDWLDSFEGYRKTNRILDVGCGVGFFLDEAKKRGWEVYGTEFTDNAINLCESKGIHMKKGKLDRPWFPEGYFDIIVSLEVLEHINNPVEEVNNINYILRKGGLFYFTTPNFNAFERYLLKEKYNVIEYPEHLCYYTPATVNLLLSKAGFRKRKIETTGISLTRIEKSKEHTEGKIVSATSSDEVLRNRLEGAATLRFAKKILNGILTFLGIGNSLKGWYIKK